MKESKKLKASLTLRLLLPADSCVVVDDDKQSFLSLLWLQRSRACSQVNKD